MDNKKIDDLIYAYNLCQEYYTKAEECLISMNSSFSPLFEYRATLEHVMRWIQNNDDTQIEKAISHLKRLFYDIVDYICINVRIEINDSLKKIHKIASRWEEYKDKKKQVYELSEKLATLRIHRMEAPSVVEALKKPKEIVDEFLKIHKEYFIYIEPELKKK